MAPRTAAFRVDPSDPRAPPQAVWDELTEDERQQVLDSLPSEIERAEPPEGDAHSLPKARARETLGEHYRRLGRRIYLGSELPIYYPDEAMFAPDLVAVLDVEPHERDHWTVSHEGRGLDFALEIHVRGSARKDFEDNVERYARLGIPEYFAFAPRRGRLAGWRLPSPEARTYQPIVPQGGRYSSGILGLDLAVEGDRLRFYYGSAALLDAQELISKLSSMVDAASLRAEEAARRAEEETRRAEEETRRAEEETRRAEGEARRAEEEARRAEEEARRADRYAALLRQAGIEPDDPERRQ